jgi:hypothetical protein
MAGALQFKVHVFYLVLATVQHLCWSVCRRNISQEVPFELLVQAGLA